MDILRTLRLNIYLKCKSTFGHPHIEELSSPVPLDSVLVQHSKPMSHVYVSASL